MFSFAFNSPNDLHYLLFVKQEGEEGEEEVLTLPIKELYFIDLQDVQITCKSTFLNHDVFLTNLYS
jgi:hypothetical protein